MSELLVPTSEDLVALEESMCREDRFWMLERHLVIQNKMGQLQLLNPMHRAQRRALRALEYQRKRKIPARLIVGKSRKKGLSTGIAADAFCEYLFNDINVLIVAHEKELSETILSYIHRYIEFLDKSMGDKIPAIHKPLYFKGDSSKAEIRFDGYQSKMWIGTAKNVYAGTGMTPQYLFATEVSKWDTGSKTAISLLQSVAMKPGTTVVWESTFNGEDTLFFPGWKAANDNSILKYDAEDNVKFEVTNPEKWNHYMPFFTGTADDPDIPLPFHTEAEKARFSTTLNEKEKVWQEKYDVGYEWLNGMRAIFTSQCQSDESIRCQEYCLNADEAIIASGKHRFNIAKLNLMQAKYVEAGQKGELTYKQRWSKKVEWQEDSGGAILRFRTPIPNHRYIVAIDVAEAKEDKRNNDPDATVIDVYDFDNGMEQVAVMGGDINPENAVIPAAMLAEYYNWAFIIPEANSIGIHVCIELGKVYPQERLYHSGENIQDSGRISREIGFKTTTSTKPIMIGHLAASIEEGSIIFHYQKTYEELRHYIKTAGKTEAAPGYHDDYVITPALAVEGARSRPVILDRRKEADGIERYYQTAKPGQVNTGRSTITGY
jgi:hypothetical protein